jgi:hypothetical protein
MRPFPLSAIRYPLPGTLILAALLAACGGAEAASLAQAVVDTLPGGIRRVTSSGPTAWRDSSGITLREEARWSGEEGTTSEIGQPRSLAVDEAGRVYIVDTKPALIKVFTPDGNLIRTIGGEGEGPGEFRVGFIAVRGGSLVVHDPQLGRTSVWDTSGAFRKSWHSSCCYWTDIQIDRQQRIYVPTMVALPRDETPRGIPFVRWSLEGAALDTLWVPYRKMEKFWTVSVKGPDGKMMSSMSTGVPFLPSLTYTLHPDSGVVYGWTGEYSLVRSGNGRDSLSLFGRAWTPEPIDEARRKAELEAHIKTPAETYGEANVRASFKLEDIPATLPAYMNLRVDPAGRIWVRRHAISDTTRTRFDVFDSTGALLGPVTLPFSINEWGMQAWTRDGLVTVIEDENGRPTLVRVRVAMPASY